MAKITQQEFKDWSQTFMKTLLDFMNSPFGQNKLSAEEQVMLTSLVSHISWGTEKENPFAVIGFVIIYEDLPDHDKMKDVVCNYTDDLTLQQWLDRFKQRVKEHAEAGGYYKPSEPVDKSALKKGWKKVWELIKKGEHNTKLKPYLNEESYNLIIHTKVYFDSMKEALEIENENDIADIKDSNRMLNEFPFLMQDLIGRVEKAQQDLAKAEEEKNKPGKDKDGSDKNKNNSPKITEKIEQLEREKKELETKNQKLEKELTNSQNKLSDSEKQRKRQEIEDNKKKIGEKDKEKEKLKGEQNQQNQGDNSKNSNKLNWAIGLGIAAVVISILGVVLLLAGQKKKKKQRFHLVEYKRG